MAYLIIPNLWNGPFNDTKNTRNLYIYLCHIPPAKIGFYDKYNGTNFSLKSNNKVLMIDLIKINLLLITENAQKVIKTYQSFQNLSKVIKTSLVHLSSNETSKDPVKISSTTAKCMSKGKTNYQSIIK